MTLGHWFAERYRDNGVRLYDGHRGNSGDGGSIHNSTAVVVTELTVYADDDVSLH